MCYIFIWLESLKIVTLKKGFCDNVERKFVEALKFFFCVMKTLQLMEMIGSELLMTVNELTWLMIF